MSQLPNCITVLRIVLVLPIAYFVLDEQWIVVLLLLVVAGVSDLLDGALARRFQWESRFGELADPLADKLTFGAVVVLLAFMGHYPLWLVFIVIGRDIGILLGAGIYRLFIKHLEIAPSLLSKLNTAVQVVVPVLVIVELQDWVASDWVAVVLDPMGYIVAAGFAIVSGVDYLIVWIRRGRSAWLAKENGSRQSGAA